MSQAAAWQWNAAVQDYVLWSAAEHCYVMRDGTRVPAVAPVYSPQPPVDSRVPRNEESAYAATNAFAAAQQTTSLNHRRDSVSAGSDYGLQHQLAGLNVSTGYGGSSTQTGWQQTLQTEGDVTDKELHKLGARARGRIKGTKGKSEPLDKKYHVQPLGRGFFKVGKVVKILWPELPGNNVEGMTVVSDAKFQKETFITKIRWFVVVKEGRESCTCVPISTYGGRGCGKPGLAKWQHCIVYTGDEEPELIDGEAPVAGELPMLSSIQVRQKDKRQKMFPESRINYGKMYTVEHNVKVYDFGEVRKSSRTLLVRQWRWVLDNNLQGNAPDVNPLDGPAGEESDDEDESSEKLQEEEEEEGTNATVPEVTLPADGKALWPWAANSAGQLAFQAGDVIRITAWADENWGRGMNVRTGAQGVFARNYVSLV